MQPGPLVIPALAALVLALPAAADPTVRLEGGAVLVEPVFVGTNGEAPVPVKLRVVSGAFGRPLQLCLDWNCSTVMEVVLDGQREQIVWLSPRSAGLSLRGADDRWGAAVPQEWAQASEREAVAVIGVGADDVDDAVAPVTRRLDFVGGVAPVAADDLERFPEAVHAFDAVVLTKDARVSESLRQALEVFARGGGVVVDEIGAFEAGHERREAAPGELANWRRYARQPGWTGPLPARFARRDRGTVITPDAGSTPVALSLAILDAIDDAAPSSPQLPDNDRVRDAAAVGVAPIAPAGAMAVFGLLFGALGVGAFLRRRSDPAALMRASLQLAAAGLVVGAAGALWHGRAPAPVEIELRRGVGSGLVEVVHGIAARPARGGGLVEVRAPAGHALDPLTLRSRLADRAALRLFPSGAALRGSSENTLAAAWREVTPGEAPTVHLAQHESAIIVDVDGTDFELLAVAVKSAGTEYFGRVDGSRATAHPYRRQESLPAGNDPTLRALRAAAQRLGDERVTLLGRRGDTAVVWEVPRW